MNKTDISREKIVETATVLLKEGGMADLNMRSVASACGVAVGSIYNYFPSKSELVLAVVEAVWSKVFHSEPSKTEPGGKFTDYLSAMYKQAYTSQKDYRSFFLIHRTLIDTEGKTQGKDAMTQYFRHIKAALLKNLEEDDNVEQAVWSGDLSREKLADFIFANILSLLSAGVEDCDFLVLLLNRILYAK